MRWIIERSGAIIDNRERSFCGLDTYLPSLITSHTGESAHERNADANHKRARRSFGYDSTITANDGITHTLCQWYFHHPSIGSTSFGSFASHDLIPDMSVDYSSLDVRVSLEQYYKIVRNPRDTATRSMTFNAFYCKQVNRIDDGIKVDVTRIPPINRMALMLACAGSGPDQSIYDQALQHLKLDAEMQNMLRSMDRWEHIEKKSDGFEMYLSKMTDRRDETIVACIAMARTRSAGRASAPELGCRSYKLPNHNHSEDPYVAYLIARALKDPSSLNEEERVNVSNHAGTHPRAFSDLYVTDKSKSFYEALVKPSLVGKMDASMMPSEDNGWSEADIDAYIDLCDLAYRGFIDGDDPRISTLVDTVIENRKGARHWLCTTHMHPSVRNATNALVYPRSNGSYSIGRFREDIKSLARKGVAAVKDRVSFLGAKVSFYAGDDLPRTKTEADARTLALRLYMEYGMNFTDVQGGTIDALYLLDDTMLRICRMRGSSLWAVRKVHERTRDIFRGEKDFDMRLARMNYLIAVLHELWVAALETLDDKQDPDLIAAVAKLQWDENKIDDLLGFVLWVCSDMADEPEVMGGPVRLVERNKDRCTYKKFREQFIRVNTKSYVEDLRKRYFEMEDAAPRVMARGIARDMITVVNSVAESVDVGMEYLIRGLKPKSVSGASAARGRHTILNQRKVVPDRTLVVAPNSPPESVTSFNNESSPALWLRDNMNRCTKLDHTLMKSGDLASFTSAWMPSYIAALIRTKADPCDREAAEGQLELFSEDNRVNIRKGLQWLYLLAGCWTFTAFANYEAFYNRESSKSNDTRVKPLRSRKDGSLSPRALILWDSFVAPIFRKVVERLSHDYYTADTPVLPIYIENATILHIEEVSTLHAYLGTNPYSVRELFDVLGYAFARIRDTESMVRHDAVAAASIGTLYHPLRASITASSAELDPNSVKRFVVLHNAMRSLAPKSNAELLLIVDGDSRMLEEMMKKTNELSIAARASAIIAVTESDNSPQEAEVDAKIRLTTLYRQVKYYKLASIDAQLGGKERVALRLTEYLTGVVSRIIGLVNAGSDPRLSATHTLFASSLHHIYPYYDNLNPSKYIALCKKHPTIDGEYEIRPNNKYIILVPTDGVMSRLFPLLDSEERLRAFVRMHVIEIRKSTPLVLKTLYGLHIDVGDHKTLATSVASTLGSVLNSGTKVITIDSILPESLMFCAVDERGVIPEVLRKDLVM
jgi:hypothetical protein